METPALDSQERLFDLNIERILENWSVAHAIREIIANALDEAILTSTTEPTIAKREDASWCVVDYGRGLRYEHLTQNENKEKLRAPNLIGRFGVGLKDAFATLHRNQIGVYFRSCHADITTAMVPKHSFDDISTLHAMVRAPSRPEMVGTEVLLTGVSDDDMAKAQDFFLHFAGQEMIECTPHGEILRKTKKKARIYVNGLYVAEEENFLFSYNITPLTAPLKRALNRERANVGRGAYTDRVKAILLSCTSGVVAEALADNLQHFQSGTMCDELQWSDVAIHACRLLNSMAKVLFLTPEQLLHRSSLVEHAQMDGYRVVVISDLIAGKISKITDIEGQPMHDLGQYRTEWQESFAFSFVTPDQLTHRERAIFARTNEIMRMVRATQRVKEVLISTTMRINSYDDNEALGVWEPDGQRIILSSGVSSKT